jgi:murE/murF fusion protein
LNDGDAAISAIAVDSREVGAGCIFFAREGWFIDSHQFIPQAIASGASALVVTRPDAVPAGCGIPVLVSDNEDRDLGLLADRFYASPTSALRVFGITGTNGKTSVAWLLAHVLEQAGERPAIIGTVGHSFNGVTRVARNTTPDGLFIHRFARECLDQGATALVMEVSSHGIELQRIAGVAFDVVAFTNLTVDHIDFHKTFDGYRAAKTQLFTLVSDDSRSRGKSVHRIVNVSSAEGECLANVVEARGDKATRVTVSDTIQTKMSVQISDCRTIDFRLTGSLTVDGVTKSVELGMPGLHNAENLAVVLGMARAVCPTWSNALPSLAHYRGVRGRIERVGANADASSNLPAAFVDYAHTPDAVERVVAVITDSGLAAESTILVGAGGDRDATKRPLMLKAALAAGGRVVVTSDNPRSENAADIADQMCADLSDEERARVTVDLDRGRAIVAAVTSNPAGGVWVLGKGHERYQEVAGTRFHFDDAQWVRWALWSMAEEVALSDVPFLAGWSIVDLAEAMGGRVEQNSAGLINRWFTDTRSPVRNGVFVALTGPRFDGHTFVSAAVDAGARVVVVERAVAVPEGVAVIVVDDTLTALQSAAARLLRERRSMARGFRVVAITGSNGKTTTKELVGALFAATGRQVLSTPGNWNNDIGLPLTVGMLRVGDDCAVLEMGAGQRGDIARLSAIAQQDTGVITSIGYAHVEGLGGLDGVRTEKLGVLAARRPPVAILPGIDAAGLRAHLSRDYPARVIEAGGANSPLRVSQAGGGDNVHVVASDGGLDGTFSFPLRGVHNLDNLCTALIAFAATQNGDFSWPSVDEITEALSAFVLPGGRQKSVRIGDRLMVDDTYNANPSSVAAALNLLSSYSSPRWVVLGDMEELGQTSESLHHGVGVQAAELADRVIAIGLRSSATASGAGAKGVHFENWQSASLWLAEHTPPEATIWVKGSRAAGLERLVAALKQAWE